MERNELRFNAAFCSAFRWWARAAAVAPSAEVATAEPSSIAAISASVSFFRGANALEVPFLRCNGRPIKPEEADAALGDAPLAFAGLLLLLLLLLAAEALLRRGCGDEEEEAAAFAVEVEGERFAGDGAGAFRFWLRFLNVW